MVVGHPGETGARVLWHVVADLKLDSGHVPILPHVTVAVIAKECLLSPSHATQTVVQVRRPPCLNHKSVDLAVNSFGINDGRSLELWCIKGALESTLNYNVGFTSMRSFKAQCPSDLETFTMIWIIPKECTLTQSSSSAAFCLQYNRSVGQSVSQSVSAPHLDLVAMIAKNSDTCASRQQEHAYVQLFN